MAGQLKGSTYALSLTFTPIARLSALITVSLIPVLVMLALATSPGRLGLDLEIDSNATELAIAGVDPRGPSGGFAGPGFLIAIEGNGERIEILPSDLIEEPDVLATYAQMRAFFARQSEIHSVVNARDKIVEFYSLDGETVRYEPGLRLSRTVWELPFAFWLQIGVGLAGVWIGAWVLTLRRGDWAARMLTLAGAGLMLSAFPAAVYSTRELAIDGATFAVLSTLNHAGALTFGIGMIGLFMLYPRRLVRPCWLLLPAALLTGWYALDALHLCDILHLAEGPGLGFHLPVVLAMATILVLVGVQYFATRGDPISRAALGWLGIAVAVGAGAFVVTIIAPNLLGIGPLLGQGEAFLFFLLIYVGVALGVARYRLFQLDEWAFRILFYVVGVVALLVLDAVLIFTIIEERVPAFALSLLLVALLYLPLRDFLARWILGRREPRREAIFRRVMDVALTPPGKDQRARWQSLLQECFNPLTVERKVGIADAVISEDGAALLVPGPDRLPGFRLEYADGGHRLFSPRDAQFAAEIRDMLQNALESRDGYEKGVAEERQRIARDIHDNIGVQLMGALHSRGEGRKNLLIRETLTDLRDIVNNASRPDMSFDEMLADLRQQISEHLHVAGVILDWHAESEGEEGLTLQTAHALRSIVREAVQNALKHAEAGRIAVTVRRDAAEIFVEIVDDGKGFDIRKAQRGNGLTNMEERVAGLGGRFEVTSDAAGTRIIARFPLNTGRMRS